MDGRAVRWIVVLVPLVTGAGAPPVVTAPEAPKTGSAEPEVAAARGFVPPRLGSPENRVSGATRGADTLQLAALAPTDIGLTARAQPRVYWYNSLPIQGASLALVDDVSDQVVLRASIPGPLPAGINSFLLTGKHGRIDSGTTYRWSLTVIPSKQAPSRTVVAGGLIERVAQPAETLWYDEVDAVSQSILHAPADRQLRQTRSTLLEQAGLTDLAAYDRAAAR